MDRGDYRRTEEAIVHGVAKSWTQLNQLRTHTRKPKVWGSSEDLMKSSE